MRFRVALLALVLVACTSKSPFSTSPASIAMKEPCRFMGTLHKESRQRLENLRMCGAISMDGWRCMSSALKALDKEYTSECRSRSVDYDEIASRQRVLYQACAQPSAVIECSLLSADIDCGSDVCRPTDTPSAND